MTPTYEALLSLLARIRDLEEENEILRKHVAGLKWTLNEGWDPGQ